MCVHVCMCTCVCVGHRPPPLHLGDQGRAHICTFGLEWLQIVWDASDLLGSGHLQRVSFLQADDISRAAGT